MTRLVAATMTLMAACTFDIKLHGIPEDINLHTPELSLFPAPKDAGTTDAADANESGGDL